MNTGKYILLIIFIMLNNYGYSMEKPYRVRDKITDYNFDILFNESQNKVFDLDTTTPSNAVGENGYLKTVALNNTTYYLYVKQDGVWRGVYLSSNPINISGLVLKAGDTMTGNLVINSSGYIPFQIGGGTLTVIGGNIGIGTTNPTSKVQISQSANTFTNGLALLNTGNNKWEFVVGSDNKLYCGYNNVGKIDLDLYGNLYISSNCSADSFTDRTPYPKDTKEAYDSINSMDRNISGGVDHNKLNPFIKIKKVYKKYNPKTDSIESVTEYGRNLSATVSAQNEVIKDLIKRIEYLEKK